MAIRPASPDPTGRKRPYDQCFDTTEASDSKKRRIDADQRIPGLFSKVMAGSSLSKCDRVQARELGRGPFSFDLSREIERGERLLTEGKIDEAKQALSFAKHSAVAKPNFVPFLIQIGTLEHDHQLYSDSLETFQLLAQYAPSYRELAHLARCLHQFYQGNRADFRSLLTDFAQKWVMWILMTPLSCPLSPDEYVVYSMTIHQFIPSLQEIREQVGVERERGLNQVAVEELEELEDSILTALFYLNLAQKDIDEVAQILDELELNDPDTLVLIYDLKNSDSERKNRAFERTQHMLIPWDEQFFAERISIKLLFNEGLKTKDPRPLQCALRNFLAIESRQSERAFKIGVKNWIFYCHLALEQYEEAQEVASSLELIQPRSAALLSTLCRLNRAETLTQDIVDDLEKCLLAKDRNVLEPSILQFIGDFIMEKEMKLSISPDPVHTAALIPLAVNFYQWASSFHGQRGCSDLILDYLWSQVGKLRDLYRQNQFEAALIQGQKLYARIVNRDFILLEMALCLFQLGRSDEAIQRLCEILTHKMESKDGYLPYIDQKLAECIPWLRSAGEDELAQKYQKWVEEFDQPESDESLDV